MQHGIEISTAGTPSGALNCVLENPPQARAKVGNFNNTYIEMQKRRNQHHRFEKTLVGMERAFKVTSRAAVPPSPPAYLIALD